MAIDFLGTDEYIDCGSSASLDNIVTFSIAAWVYWDSFVDNDSDDLIEKYDRAAGSNGWLLFFNDNNAGTANCLHFIDVCPPATVARWRTGANTVSTGAWTHVALTFDAGSSANNPIFYINGALSATTEMTAPVGAFGSDAAYTLKIAGDTVNSQYMDGRLEDVRYFNSILSANEVATLAAGYRGPLGGEVLWLPMSEVDGATLSSAAAVVFDMSGNGNHGTPQGGCLGFAGYAPRSQGWIP